MGVTGGIQPDRMRTLLMKSDDDGFILIGRLLTLEMPRDGDGNKRPWFVPFTARNLMDEFRKQVREWENKSEGLLKSFIGKLPA